MSRAHAGSRSQEAHNMMSGMARKLISGRVWGNLTACGLPLALAGCVSDRPRPASRPPATVKGPVDQIHILTGPTALDLDSVPGPDGFGVRVYASSSKAPATVVIARGTLEILMFDGLLKDGNPTSAKPLRVWTFTPGDLKKSARKSSVGTAYDLTLVWGGTKPRQDKITLMARFVPQHGPPIYPGPSSISTAVK